MNNGNRGNNKWARLMCVILLLNVLVACGNISNEATKPMNHTILPESNYGNRMKLERKRKETEHFITDTMSGPYGVYTNFRDSLQSDPAATGHEVLSESAGILMRYYALTNQKEAFLAEWKRAKETFELPSGFSYRYSPKQDRAYTINAAVDDMRIIRALHEAGQQFDEQELQILASAYGTRFVEHNIRDWVLYDFYDEKYKMTNDFVTLCYIDLTTLKLLPISASEQVRLIERMEKVIQGGYLSNEFPFYETRYHYDTDTYDSEGINTVESLLTILSLAEAGQHRSESIEYVKDKVRSGTLYGKYTKDGAPMNDIQSTAIYAIAAMIGSVLQDAELYKDSIMQMEKFRIDEQASSFYGGFGDPSSEMAFSFDNLMALLAYAY